MKDFACQWEDNSNTGDWEEVSADNPIDAAIKFAASCGTEGRVRVRDLGPMALLLVKSQTTYRAEPLR